ncbi:MAG: NAD synthetase [Planctomycetota bacterium]|nr:MAG: NAD synthetase [Planctomycetota bacterium]
MGWYIYLYILGSAFFIIGMKGLTRVKTARSSLRLAALGMALAMIAAIIQTTGISWWMLLLGLAIGSAIGGYLAVSVPMTAMPELVAAFNGFGGVASAFVAFAAAAKFAGIADIAGIGRFAGARNVGLTLSQAGLSGWIMPATVFIGMLTLVGSFVAYFKLGGKKMLHPLQGAKRNQFHIALGVVSLGMVFWSVFGGTGAGLWIPMIIIAITGGLLGWYLTLPIGGADMPVVVALLNSYSGIAAAASGFVIGNFMLITGGALVGASGLILTKIMCKAMNRSLGNVLIGGIGDDSQAEDARDYTNVKETSPEEVAMLCADATSVVIVPGYGLAVAQAQHVTRELADELIKAGVEVRYAIHPVAGRMPGHMNVLLAEADVPVEQLFEMDQINADFKQTDLVIVTGANDVVNPVARTDPQSPIAGMPILDVIQAQTVVVIKRSLSPGYAGIKNPLFEADNCLMLFSDAKKALTEMVEEVKDL